MTDWPARLKAWSDMCNAYKSVAAGNVKPPSLAGMTPDEAFAKWAAVMMPEAIARIRELEHALNTAYTELCCGCDLDVYESHDDACVVGIVLNTMSKP